MLTPYDRIADAYVASRTGFQERRFLDALIAPFSGPVEVLDLGCGAGSPIARYLLDAGHRVTGVDRSRGMLRRARKDVPDARLLLADIRTLQLARHSVDVIVAWDSVFHVPRAEHEAIYERWFEWLRPGGRCLLSLGGSEWEGTATMFGEAFFYSAFEPRVAKKVIEGVGFRIAEWEVDDPSSRGHIAAILDRPAEGVAGGAKERLL